MILLSIAFEFRGTGKQLEIFVLAHFLDANRYPLRLKMPGARPALHTRRRQQGPRNSCAIRVAGRRPRFLENVEASNAASSIPGPTNLRNKRSNFSRSSSWRSGRIEYKSCKIFVPALAHGRQRGQNQLRRVRPEKLIYRD
jgi:hypothetical protein